MMSTSKYRFRFFRNFGLRGIFGISEEGCKVPSNKGAGVAHSTFSKSAFSPDCVYFIRGLDTLVFASAVPIVAGGVEFAWLKFDVTRDL